MVMSRGAGVKPQSLRVVHAATAWRAASFTPCDLQAHRLVLWYLPSEYRGHYTLATISVTKRSICVFSSALLLPR
jgi:hypothetical protein